MLIIITIATFCATMLGGLFALRLKDKLHLILGFSAGAVVAVAFFDLIPESLEIGGRFFGTNTIITITAIGFVVYLLLDRLIFLHVHGHSVHEGHECDHDPSSIEVKKMGRGILGASSLSIHSLFDGIAVGIAFQVSTAVGAIVAVAVLAHDFSDGINTVNLILRGNGDKKQALKWLLIDAIAPVIGIISTLFFTVPEQTLGIILALFSGFFLYMGASDLIPESHHSHPKFLTTAMTIIGIGVMYIVISAVG